MKQKNFIANIPKISIDKNRECTRFVCLIIIIIASKESNVLAISLSLISIGTCTVCWFLDKLY